MNNIIIRYATLSDAKAITELKVSCWKSAYRGILPDEMLEKSSEQMKNETEHRAKCIVENTDNGWPNIVAVHSGQVIGWCAGGVNQNPAYKHETDLQAIYILKEYQRKGIGKLMVKAFIDLMHEHGMQSMLIWVLKENHNAIRFYTKLGGKIVGEKLYLKKYPVIGFGWDDVKQLGRNSG